LGQVPVEAIDAGVQLPIGVPADAEILQCEAGVLGPGVGPRPEPALAQAGEEGLGIADGFLVVALVIGGPVVGGGLEVGRNGIGAVGHGGSCGSACRRPAGFPRLTPAPARALPASPLDI